MSALLMLLLLLLLATVCATSASSNPLVDHVYPNLSRGRQAQSVSNSNTGTSTTSATGTISALVLLVLFPEDANKTLPSRDYFDQLCNEDMAAYFRQQSYGQYVVQCDVRDWRQTNDTADAYARSVANLVGRDRASDFFRPVLEQWADDDGYTTSDWNMLDANGDGVMDALLVLHSGYGAENYGGAECGAPLYYDRIHSQGHRHEPLSNARDGNADSVPILPSRLRLSGYAIASAFDSVCTDAPATMGTMTHEWLHILGAHDTYGGGASASRNFEQRGTVGGIASFDTMAHPRGPDPTTDIPASMSAYSKHTVGWLSYTDVTFNGLYTLESSSRVPHAVRIVMDQFVTPFEYLLLEYRAPISYDANLFGGGLLIYHVDDRSRTSARTNSTRPSHHRVALLQADGNYDLERGINLGDAGDFWREGMVLGPSTMASSGMVMSNTSTTTDEAATERPPPPPPNTDSYENGPTGLVISVLAVNDTHASFRVDGLTDEGTTSGSSGGGNSNVSTSDAPWRIIAPAPTRSSPAPTSAPVQPEPTKTSAVASPSGKAASSPSSAPVSNQKQPTDAAMQRAAEAPWQVVSPISSTTPTRWSSNDDNPKAYSSITYDADSASDGSLLLQGAAQSAAARAGRICSTVCSLAVLFVFRAL